MLSKLEEIYDKMKNEPGYSDKLVDEYIKYLDSKYDYNIKGENK